MATPRRLLVPEGLSRCYHCVSRCVRRAFLCDDDGAHRKDWIKQRLLELGQIFAVEVGGFAIMANHLHLMVRTQPDWAEAWSNEEVARRWLALYPQVGAALRDAGVTSEREIVQRLVANRARLAAWRERLASLSWFMKCLKEPIARRANREDRVTGHFWEGRFRSQALLDEAAVVACLVYIDLNPIRAAVAATPERSDHTSVQDRIQVRECHRRSRPLRAPGARARAPHALAAGLAISTLPAGRVPGHGEDGIWLIPIEQRAGLRRERDARRGGREGRGRRDGLTSLTLDEYLTLVDLTGRQVRLGKRGRIPPTLAPILSRLEVDGERWLTEMLGHSRRIGTAIGSAASLAMEAARRGTKWVVGACPCIVRSRRVEAAG
jgi:REP element-mobilizing transposase RayT